MRLLLGGSDLEKLQRVRIKLLGMGVACDIVQDKDLNDASGLPIYPEVWVRREEDFDTAALALRSPGLVGAAWRGGCDTYCS